MLSVRNGVLSLAAGLAVLLIAETAGWGALRMLAIVLLVGGAIVAGISAGSGARAAELLTPVARRFSRMTVCVIALLLAAPTLLVLAMAVFGALAGVSAAPVPVVVAGGASALLLLVVTLIALLLALGAIRGQRPGTDAGSQS